MTDPVTLAKDVWHAELVAFCQEQQRRIQKDRASLNAAEDLKRRAGDEAAAREFERVDWMRQGEQIALRNVCEWAAAQRDSEASHATAV